MWGVKSSRYWFCFEKVVGYYSVFSITFVFGEELLFSAFY
jgi:hypothetical protein